MLSYVLFFTININPNLFIDVNIVCNNCIGSHVYYKVGLRLTNQFQWCGIDLKDFVYLAKNWRDMDLSNVDFKLETRLYQTRESVLCTVDEKVKVHYSHYLQDEGFTEPGKCDRYKYCMLSNDIIGYARNKYFSRMGRTDEPITFVYCFNLWDMRHPKARKEYPVALDELLTITDPLVVLMHESVDIGDREIPENVTLLKVPDSELTFCSDYMVDTLIDLLIKK